MKVPSCGVGQRIARVETALEPLPRDDGMPAQELDLALNRTRGDQQCGIVGLLRHRLDPLG